MPYHTSRGFERASKLGDVPTAENPEITTKLGLYRRPDDGDDSYSLDPYLIAATDSTCTMEPVIDFAVAIDWLKPDCTKKHSTAFRRRGSFTSRWPASSATCEKCLISRGRL